MDTYLEPLIKVLQVKVPFQVLNLLFSAKPCTCTRKQSKAVNYCGTIVVLYKKKFICTGLQTGKKITAKFCANCCFDKSRSMNIPKVSVIDEVNIFS